MKHTERSLAARTSRSSRFIAAAAAGLGVAVLAACSATPSSEPAQPGSDAAAPAAHDTRLAVSTPGGVTVLSSGANNGGDFATIGSLKTDEFTRLNAFGDGKHLLLSTSQGFEVLDADSAELTGLVFPATTPGHVVRHDGSTMLFDDGTGHTTVLATDALLKDDSHAPASRTYEADAPHHGVSIELSDGTLLTTVGTDEGRTGALALEGHDDHWHEHATSDECPGIHGEGTARDEVAVFGCEDGALLFKNGSFTKLTAPDAFGRMGNAFAADDSPFVVGDYKNDPDAEGYLLSAVTLIDTAAETLTVAELPENVRYTFRDVVRGPEGNAYILSADGAIHVLDPKTGKIIDSFDVIAPWEGPANWQDAHPAIVADGDIAYVTEPATKSIHAVDLATGKTIASTTLDGVPNELAVAVG
ncbi:zinc metallochaperone AztD [Leucobacter komagatae]|uniref:zinc metallochaperone AztD n=1 Tax=Leucobacter komagatae TaxID=55969 RepID=UPI0005AC2E68|nr:zinc metallochaperone AztD [Leucobacter komagatae]